jgi:hypothetical protein
VLASLVRAAQLRPTLAAAYAQLEAEIGHRFRNDMSMADIITAAEESAASEHADEAETIELGLANCGSRGPSARQTVTVPYSCSPARTPTPMSPSRMHP